MMEGTESPLDVLSRAATMVQENQALSSSSSSSSSDDSTKSNSTNQKQTTKWKRDRRARLPEYTRKSDPKFNETFNIISEQSTTVASMQESNPPPLTISNGGSSTSSPALAATNGNGHHHDHPLDMSLRQRGQPPPSYAQTISNPGYRSSYRPSVIHNGGPICSGGINREELPSGISMCDPIIDEHFRRSLGSDYHTVFQNNNLSSSSTNKSGVDGSRLLQPLTSLKSPPPKPPQQKPTSQPVSSPIVASLPPPPMTKISTTMKTTTASTRNVIEMMDTTGMSVDDHFAKALGDTWAKLNRKKDAEIKRDGGTKENNLVTI